MNEMKQGILKKLGYDDKSFGCYFVDIECQGQTKRYYACWQDRLTRSVCEYIRKHFDNLTDREVAFRNVGDDLVSLCVIK